MREKLIDVFMHLDRHIQNRDEYGICYTSDFAEAVETVLAMLKRQDANGVTVQQWIPVTERLPEEHDSIFTSFHGTEKWQDGMFLKCSDTVLASVEYEDCKRRVKAIVTKDGKWNLSQLYRASKVTHWMPLPQPPKEG